ncbi:MAG: hypothetical protein ACREGJ_04480 [Candidatus Saccharimonadales bacterium]
MEQFCPFTEGELEPEVEKRHMDELRQSLAQHLIDYPEASAFIVDGYRAKFADVIKKDPETDPHAAYLVNRDAYGAMIGAFTHHMYVEVMYQVLEFKEYNFGVFSLVPQNLPTPAAEIPGYMKGAKALETSPYEEFINAAVYWIEEATKTVTPEINPEFLKTLEELQKEHKQSWKTWAAIAEAKGIPHKQYLPIFDEWDFESIRVAGNYSNVLELMAAFIILQRRLEADAGRPLDKSEMVVSTWLYSDILTRLTKTGRKTFLGVVRGFDESAALGLEFDGCEDVLYRRQDDDSYDFAHPAISLEQRAKRAGRCAGAMVLKPRAEHNATVEHFFDDYRHYIQESGGIVPDKETWFKDGFSSVDVLTALCNQIAERTLFQAHS